MTTTNFDGKWRHKKRGTTYKVVGLAILQYSGRLDDMTPMVVYRSESDGSLWVRSENEFIDGRFERVPYSNINECPSCKRMFKDGETCSRGGCPMGGDF